MSTRLASIIGCALVAAPLHGCSPLMEREASTTPALRMAGIEVHKPNASDAAIVRRAAQLLSNPSDWNASCERSTETGAAPYSLYTALRLACTDIVGHYEHPPFALEEVRRVIDRTCPDAAFTHRLRDFNNTRSHGAVLAVLRAAGEAIEEQLYFLRTDVDGGPAFQALRTNTEIELRMRELAHGRPRWFRYTSIGRTVQGRPIPLLHVSDHDSTREKTGVWIDAGIHGFETACPEVVIGLAEDLAERLARGRAPDWLGRVDLFLVPVLNVDGRELCMRPPYPVLRANLCPSDDDGDGRVDEESFVDLNGDGRIAWLNRPGHEHTYESLDADGDGRWGEDLPGGVDLNRDYPVTSRERPADWTPQPETRAVIDFWLAHPQIELAVSYHTSINMFISPYVPLNDEETERYANLAARFLEHFPGVHWNMHASPDAYGVAQPLTGMNIEWFHAARGATAFILEIGPDDRPRREPPQVDTLQLSPTATGSTLRIPTGYYRQVETHLEAELTSLRTRHARYLTDLIATVVEGK
ncbi:MAG: hypothetical protein GY711_03665 [bacterium]|nr:hypothetical protein [bacterium]